MTISLNESTLDQVWEESYKDENTFPLRGDWARYPENIRNWAKWTFSYLRTQGYEPAMHYGTPSHLIGKKNGKLYSLKISHYGYAFAEANPDCFDYLFQPQPLPSPVEDTVNAKLKSLIERVEKLKTKTSELGSKLNLSKSKEVASRLPQIDKDIHQTQERIDRLKVVQEGVKSDQIELEKTHARATDGVMTLKEEANQKQKDLICKLSELQKRRETRIASLKMTTPVSQQDERTSAQSKQRRIEMFRRLVEMSKGVDSIPSKLILSLLGKEDE